MNPRVAALWLAPVIPCALACQEPVVITERPPVVQERPDINPVGPDTIVDEVVQTTPSAIDVLWVIDDSGSMQDEQALLALEFPEFMTLALDANADVHIGVTTTDASGDDGGALRQTAAFRWVSADTPNPVGTFADMVQVGITGSGNEMGRRAAWLALTDPLSSTFNEGFYRDEATLHIVFVSDEEDNSALTPSVNEFVSFLDNLKTNPDDVATHAIVMREGDPACANEVGAGYVRLAEETGGTTFSLCEEDWRPILTDLGLTASGLVNEVFLSRLPRPGTLRVEVEEANGFVWDGVNEDIGDACEADRCITYRYDDARNAVELISLVPPEGATIRLMYEDLSGA